MQVVTTGQAPEPRYGSAGGIVPGSGEWFMASHGFSTRRFKDTFALRLSDNVWVPKTPQEGESLAPSREDVWALLSHGVRWPLPGEIPFNRCLHSGIALPSARIAIATGCGSGGYV